jgi:hypothetical protein
VVIVGSWTEASLVFFPLSVGYTTFANLAVFRGPGLGLLAMFARSVFVMWVGVLGDGKGKSAVMYEIAVKEFVT